MLVLRNLEDLPRTGPVTLTLGTFDGVHRGHRKIIDRTIAIARDSNTRSILLTFDPHPREVIGRRGSPTYLLTTIDERIRLLEKTGLDTCVVLPFTRDLSVLDAAAFFEEYLIHRLHATHLVVGVDHAFGRGRAGTVPELERLGKKFGIAVSIVGEMMIDGVKVSSTSIRNALLDGRPKKAAAFLGRPYTLSGIVVRGEGIGSLIGFPTANIEIGTNNKLIPKNGVYLVMVQSDGEIRDGIMNVGLRPTVSKQMHISVEVHIFNTSGDLYGRQMRIALLDRLRDEIRFDSRDQLVEQITSDILFAR
ncbi:MAG: bifunctional riboflavin kinase/FAD synthetase, partial [Bacteroidetes bacterium]|nr:bifunctional riboflavin kinase/FAD synthetase [Bacteroidota bacterium]